MWQTAAFGAGVALTLASALAGARRRGNCDTIIMAVLFIGTFAGSNFIYYTLGSLISYKLQPANDIAAAFVAFILLRERFADWKLGIVFIASLKMTTTALFWWTGGPAQSPQALFIYGLLLQVGFALQLGVVAWAGIGADGARAVGAWVGDHLRAAVAYAASSPKVRH